MSSTLSPCDAQDLSLLIRAAHCQPGASVLQLDDAQLRQLVERKGIDFATAVLYQRTRREYGAFASELDQLYHSPIAETPVADTAFVYVPNLAFFADPKSQAVGQTICRAAERWGCRSQIAPTSATLSLRTNARIVCETVASCRERSIVVCSVSKGSADVKMALREPEGFEVFGRVSAWMDVCGLSDGSPLVNELEAESGRSLQRKIERWFRGRGTSYVREVLAATRELAHGPGTPLGCPLAVPDHVYRLNVVAFPTDNHFSFGGSRALHRAIAAYGPNDGYGLLREMVLRPGVVYPIWGTDHYFEAHLDVDRLARALLAFLITHGRTTVAERPAKAAGKKSRHLNGAAAHSVMSPDTQAPPRAVANNSLDGERLRHARARHDGFSVGRYLQPAPMLFTRDGHNVFLGDMYRGRSAFLIAGGPSLGSFELRRLEQRGVLTCGLNNAAAVYRPNLWISVDDPGNFVESIWRDPAITKFVPLCHMEKHFMVRDAAQELVPSQEVVGDMPAVFAYRRNEHFNHDQWLFEDTFNWGNHSKRVDLDGNKGSRSVMYVALRMLFYLGIRRLFLLGCDFRMVHGEQNYAFDQDRSASSVRGNNESYRVMNQRLRRLLPGFEREGYSIFNCTPNSGLTVFPYLPFDEALATVLSEMPLAIDTAGMYDRQQRERDQARAIAVAKA